MKKIQTYQMLIAEKDRTQRAIDQIQEELKNKIVRTEAKVNPILGVISGVSKNFGSSKSSLLQMGIGSALNFIIRKRLLKNASPIVKFGGGVIGKSLLAGFILKKLIGKKKSTK